jgi:lipoate---protein ligase
MAPLSRLLSRPVQIYVSRSRDPFLNLSIEHHFLEKSPADSVVLFLYINRPCVVIGRNQNPWREVNLGLVNRPGLGLIQRGNTFSNSRIGNGAEPRLQAPFGHVSRHRLQASMTPWLGPEPTQSTRSTRPSYSSNSNDPDADDAVYLVRRRSGGGAVFHDEGNVNYSVICPPADFGRDKHAELVVRALQDLGAKSTRVNQRHDIVMDVEGGSFKISGSAYKLTRLRALHHGTCLLSTPNLGHISQFLHSPAEPFIHARGVDSVRSKIGNVQVENADFEEAVVEEFGRMYDDVEPKFVTEEEAREVPEIMEGYNELRSRDWIYGSTPRFTFSTHPTEEDPRERPPLPDYLPEDFEVSITSRHAEILDAEVSGLSKPLESTYLHKVHDWRTLVGETGGKWLNHMFGAPLGQ